MIAWTNIEERHAVKIARHPVLHAAFRGARRHRDMRWRFQHVPVRHGARSRGRHVSWSVLDGAFAGLMPDGAVFAFDRRQRGMFRKSFEEYAATRIIPAPIKRAKQLMQRHGALLARTHRAPIRRAGDAADGHLDARKRQRHR